MIALAFTVALVVASTWWAHFKTPDERPRGARRGR
jgi:hypothetical protein